MANKNRVSIHKPGNHQISLIFLIVIVFLSVLIYRFVFVKLVDLLELYPRARLDITYLYDGGKPLRDKFVYAFISLGILYLIGFQFARKARGKTLWGIVLGGSLLFGIVLLFLYPFDAADTFDNIIRGRILGVYGGNPFLQIPKRFPNDPFLQYSAWKYATSAYGPVWELMAGWTAKLTRDGFLASIFAFKLLSGFFLIASLAIISLILREMKVENKPALVLLLAWNPLVLYETWGNGHNDIVMVFWILAASWLLIKRHYTFAVLALTIGALIKFIPALLIPAAVLIALKSMQNNRERIRFLILSAISALLLIVVTYLPFWQGVQVLTIERRASLFSASFPAVLYHVLNQGDERVGIVIAWGAFCLVLLFAVWQGFKGSSGQNGRDFPQVAFNILTFYLLVACLWFQQWYVLWLVGLVPLLRSVGARSLAIFFSFAALSKQFIYGPTLLLPHPQYPQPWLEIRFALGVLAPTWIFAIILLIDQARVKMALKARLGHAQIQRVIH